MDCWSKGDTLTGEGWTVGVKVIRSQGKVGLLE